MRKFLLLLSVITSQIISAQNVGIGITTPQATRDVRGTYRIGGFTAYMMYDSVDYGKFTTVLVEAIKEQQKQINALKLIVEKLINK